MSSEKILVVDDEEDIIELVRYNLSREGYQVKGVNSSEAALGAISKDRPDLLILDVMLPNMDGFEMCKKLKQSPSTSGIPIIMLTAKGEEADVVCGLELGAVDYVVKPFSPRVLLARVKNVLTRIPTETVTGLPVITLKQLNLHPGRHEVNLAGEKLDLTATEFRILHCLARRPGWVFTRGQIVNEVQGEDFAVTDRTIDVHITSLRKKFGPYGEYIHTVRGIGYKMLD